MTESSDSGHEAVLDVAELVSGYGANLILGELRARLQCRRCGAKAASLYALPARDELLIRWRRAERVQ